MAIVQRTPPANGQETIARALSRRVPHAETFFSPLGGAPAVGAPLPIYNIELDQVGLPDPLSAARMVGWRYPVVGGPEPGLAHLSEDSAANAVQEYQGLTKGRLPQRLLDAAQIADAALAGSKQDYEPRLLQIPALHIMALWMAGQDNRFVLLSDGKSADLALPPRLIDDIRPVIRAAMPPPAAGGAASPPGSGPTN